MRNPKDVSVSLYHFTRLNKICQNDMQLDEFFSLFIDGDGKCLMMQVSADLAGFHHTNIITLSCCAWKVREGFPDRV